MPIRSSDSNISRACCLVKDMITIQFFSRSILSEDGGLGQMPRRRLLLPHSKVLDHRQNCADHRQSDQNSQRRFVVSIEETQDMAAIDESQSSLDEVANPPAKYQGCEEFFSRVLHGARSNQEWKERKRRRQQRRNHNRGESPARKCLGNLGSFFLRE